ncbi:MAG TPA: hypothetical protein VEL76_06365 [Gemmataceae bacterium]|nr:hypothetical protein [Gemmataceae bacterium]
MFIRPILAGLALGLALLAAGCCSTCARPAPTAVVPAPGGPCCNGSAGGLVPPPPVPVQGVPPTAPFGPANGAVRYR